MEWNMLRLLCCLLLFLPRTAANCPVGVPDTCKCISPVMITCENAGLVEVPKSLPHTLTFLDLSNNDINELPPDCFDGLSQLQTLIVSNTSLSRIEPHAFRGLRSVRILSIFNNPKLKRLTRYAFSNLSKVDTLYLVKNGIEVIEGDAFRGTEKVNVIELQDNPLRVLRSGAFSGLKRVRDIVISTTREHGTIEEIEPDAFIGLAEVERIWLSGIPMKTIVTNAFRGLSQTGILNLSRSRIERVETHAFFGISRIDHIDLQSNQISEIQKQAFAGVRNVTEINLKHNQLSLVHQDAFSDIINSIRRVILRGNPLICSCDAKWLLSAGLEHSPFLLPDKCAGPNGYDCVGLSQLSADELPCSSHITAPCTPRLNSVPLQQDQSVPEISRISDDSQPTASVVLDDNKRNVYLPANGSHQQFNLSSHLLLCVTALLFLARF